MYNSFLVKCVESCHGLVKTLPAAVCGGLIVGALISTARETGRTLANSRVTSRPKKSLAELWFANVKVCFFGVLLHRTMVNMVFDEKAHLAKE